MSGPMHAAPAANPAGLIDEAGFQALAEGLCGSTPAGCDRIGLSLEAEASDFLRFNRAALRQATAVVQAEATVSVVRGQRRAQASTTLSGDLDRDLALLRAERDALLADLDHVPEDPWLALPEQAAQSRRDDRGALPTAEAVIEQTTRHAQGLDFVGFYAGGPVLRAQADSLGSRHWHRSESFLYSWCGYHHGDKAVKQELAGTRWQEADFAARVQQTRERLPLLARAPRPLQPGRYRALLSPAAMVEILGTLGWMGFGLKARRTGVSPLCRLAAGEQTLDARFHLSEDFATGIAPGFTAEGFARPAQVPLIVAGRVPAEGGTLNAPRSAREYGLPPNGARAEEFPEALHLAPGRLPEAEALQALGTGLYISNLWYLNYSDRQACRLTGMTRFASFWVEDGRLVAPLPVMRFDDEVPRLFGEGLIDLTDRAELVPHNDTYGGRMLASITTPGALVEGFRLTL